MDTLVAFLIALGLYGASATTDTDVNSPEPPPQAEISASRGLEAGVPDTRQARILATNRWLRSLRKTSRPGEAPDPQDRNLTQTLRPEAASPS